MLYCFANVKPSSSVGRLLVFKLKKGPEFEPRGSSSLFIYYTTLVEHDKDVAIGIDVKEKGPVNNLYSGNISLFKWRNAFSICIQNFSLFFLSASLQLGL